MRYARVSLICAFSIISTAAPAYADLIAYEGFEYGDIGGVIPGKDGGTGFRRSWSGPGEGLDIVDGSLNFLGLETEGNRAIMAKPPGNFWREFSRTLETEISRDDTAIKYLSFLLRPEGTVGDGPFGGFFGVDLYADSRAFIGKAGASSIYGMVNWGAFSNSHSSPLIAVSDETALFVVKAELTPGIDSLTLYVNPIPGQPEPVIGTVKNDVDIGRPLGLGVSGVGPFSVDEIRWGDTFADVTPSAPTTTVELIGSGQQWNIFAGTTEPSPFPELAWAAHDFDDNAWGMGQEGFGYGPGIETRSVVTMLNDMKDNYSTVYLRHPFHVEDPVNLSNLVLQIDWDDAFVAYINGVEVTRSNVGTSGIPEPFDARTLNRSGAAPANFIIDLSSIPDLLRAGDENILAIQGINSRSTNRDFVLSQITLLGLAPTATMLQAGDADQDLDFDQLDLVQVQIAAKYLTGQAATWGEGDWNGAPGGSPGSPPAGDGLFNQLDIVAAQQAGIYLTGPYAAVQPNGQRADSQTSIVYDANTGELGVDAPAGTELTSINIDSAAGIFTGTSAQNLGGSFDNDGDNNIFKATFGSSFGSLSFGNVARVGLSEAMVLSDLTVVGSLAGGGDLGNVDLVYVPEPSSVLLLTLGALALAVCRPRLANGRNYNCSTIIVTSSIAVVSVFCVDHHVLGQLPVPPELDPGDSYQLVFNSSTFTDAASTDINVYNLLVQEAADAAGIGSSEGVTWTAIVSTSSIDARDNAVVGMNTPVYNMNLDLVATGFTDMWDGTLNNSIEWNETGEFNSIDTWTGTLPDGTGAPGLTLGHSDLAAWCGHPPSTGLEWLKFMAPPTSLQLHLYALSQPLTVTPELQAGDANQNLDFDQMDLVLVQIAGKYLTGQAATWGEGDWNGAPGGEPGNPPPGDGVFNQLDIIAALGTNAYLAGPYNALRGDGQADDGQTSVGYDAKTGAVWVDAPSGTELTSVNIDSAVGIFTGDPAANLGGSFDNDGDGNIFKATFGGSFGSLSFGNIAQTGLSEEFVLGDLTAVGSLAGGGDLGNVDLVYVPEPTSSLLLAIGLVIGLSHIRRARG